MKKIATLFCFLVAIQPVCVQAQNECTGQEQIEYILKYKLWFLKLTKYNKDCSQITHGDFNNDGKQDYAAVLTEVKPLDRYKNGKEWYRTYVAVFLQTKLPYHDYQIVFVRTDGNKPKRFGVKAIQTKDGHDLVVTKKRYSYTRYHWGDNGFKSIEHTAD